MSYRIGQFRSSQVNSYFNPINTTLDWDELSHSFYEEEIDVIFSNVCAYPARNLQSQNYYYIRFKVKRKEDSVQRFYLKLCIRSPQTIEDEEQQQTIEEFIVNKGEGYESFQAIIAPNTTYNQILWELRRSYLDYTITNSRETTGRLMDIEIEEYAILNNIKDVLQQTYLDLKSLKKIGVQGPPSLLMCINGEQIRIGKSGIYEINNPGIAISFISFVPRNIEYFIMDFEY